MSELFQRGLDEYDKGDYFEAHEAWEDLWSDYNFPDRNTQAYEDKIKETKSLLSLEINQESQINL